MASKAVIKDGKLFGVWDDGWRGLLEHIGMIDKVERATEVEFEQETGEWVATYLATRTEIARGRDRAEVIRQEVLWLERNVVR